MLVTPLPELIDADLAAPKPGTATPMLARLGCERVEADPRDEDDRSALWLTQYPAPDAAGEHEAAGAANPARLWPDAPTQDRWRSTGLVTTGQSGPLRWRLQGGWLHARVVIDDASHAEGLIGASRQAYVALFDLLTQHTGLQPLRFWNYLADINAETPSAQGVLERYRQFNFGRQQAFEAAGHSAYDGAPAACALGTTGGALQVQMLAGPVMPRALENPRQVSAYRYPADYGPRSPSFSRAASLPLGKGASGLFISGTAAIVGHQSLHPGDVVAQTRETLANIDLLLSQARLADPAAGWSAADLHCTIYLRHAADLTAVRRAFDQWLDHHGAAADAPARQPLVLRADVCRSELLVEIEAHAVVGAMIDTTRKA